MKIDSEKITGKTILETHADIIFKTTDPKEIRRKISKGHKVPFEKVTPKLIKRVIKESIEKSINLEYLP